MNSAPEVFYGIGAAILAIALIWGVIAYRTRNRSLDGVTECATRDLYKQTEEEERRHDSQS